MTLCTAETFDRWSACPGSVALEASVPPGKPDERDAMRFLAQECLTQHLNPEDYIGQMISVAGPHPAFVPGDEEGVGYVITEEIAGPVRDFLVQVRDQEARLLEEGATDVVVRAGQHLSLEPITGETRSWVVVDALIIAQFPDHSGLHGSFLNYQPSRQEAQMIAFAAATKYGALHIFSSAIVGNERFSEAGIQPVDDHARQQAALAIRIIQDGALTALNHLNTGKHCEECRAAEKCPALHPKTAPPRTISYDSSGLA